MLLSLRADHLSSSVRSGLCTSSHLGSFITTLPADKNLEDTSIFTSGIRFDPTAFPAESPEPAEGDEDPALEEITSVADEVEPGLGMTATSSGLRSSPTNSPDEEQEDAGQEENIDPNAAADEAAEELYNEILNGEDGSRRSRRGLRWVRRQSRLAASGLAMQLVSGNARTRTRRISRMT